MPRSLRIPTGKRPTHKRRPALPVFSVYGPEVYDSTTKLTLAVSPMNGTETKWAERLEAERVGVEPRVIWWAFQAIKLRLGNGAWYTPDFLSLRSDGTMHVDEIKGHWEEAARVRIKTAASLYPFYRFTAVKRVKGQWESETIKAVATVFQQGV